MLPALGNVWVTYGALTESYANINHISQFCSSLNARQKDREHKHSLISTADRINLPLIHHTQILSHSASLEEKHEHAPEHTQHIY